MVYRPYDYVVSAAGIVGSFRAYTESGHVAFRPVYLPSAHGWTKLAPRQAALLPGSRHLLLDQDCLIAPEREISPLATWTSHEVGTAGPPSAGHPEALRRLLAELHTRNARVYLYGSRLLGMESGGSDWDFIIDHRGNLAELLRSCRSLPDGSLGPQDIASIAASYEFTFRRSTARADILKILSRSWCAVRIPGGIIDFFQGYGTGQKIPDMRLDAGSLADYEGTILPSAGMSFRMPREVHMCTSAGRTVNLHHTSWLLCGLEQLAGSRVMLHDVFVHGSSDVWLSPWISRFSVEE
jgi:hypothetical protein